MIFSALIYRSTSHGPITRAVAFLLLLLINLMNFADVNAAQIPEQVTGIWGTTDSNGHCKDDQRIILVNSIAAIIFEREGKSRSVVIGPAAWIAGTIVLTRTEGEIILPPLNNLTKCEHLPGEYYAILGEAITFFRGFDVIKNKCDKNDYHACVKSIFTYFDVSKDGKLSQAEIARTFRAAGFFLGYEFFSSKQIKENPRGKVWNNYRVRVQLIYGSSAFASLLGPFFTDNFIASFDYDADGVLSLEELLQDRGVDSLIGASGAVGSAAAQTALQAMIRVMIQIFNVAIGIIGKL